MMANPWDELVMHAKACHDAMGGAVVSLTATPYKVHINNVGQVFVYKDDGVPVHAKISTTRYSPDEQCPPVPDEQQAADPYAELKDALAAGKAIQVDIGGSHWGDCLRPEWLCPPDCYRAKPEEPATTAPAQDAIASPAEADDGPVTVLSVLACAASHMAARAATYAMYEEEARKNPAFARIYKEWKAFLDQGNQWFKVAEASYANYLFYAK